jgi:hypothetical protein
MKGIEVNNKVLVLIKDLDNVSGAQPERLLAHEHPNACWRTSVWRCSIQHHLEPPRWM